MIRRVLFILLVSVALTGVIRAATWASWNGVTVGSSAGNISKWQGTTIGTAATNIGSWNGLISPSSGTPIGTPSGSAGVGDTATSSISSGARTTSATDLLLAYAGYTQSCSGTSGSSAFSAALTSVIADTGSDTWNALIPSGGAYLIGMHLVSGGTYTGTPTCTISGGGATTQATCQAVFSGGTVTTLNLQTSGDGTYTSAPTISFSGGGQTVSAVAVPTVYGVSSATFCSTAFYAPNIAATTNNVVTLNLPGTHTFRVITVSEVSGLATTNPLDTSANGTTSGTSVTSNSATPSNAATIGLCGSEVFNNAAQTWVAGNVAGVAGSLVSGSIPNGNTAADNFIATEYKIFASAPTGTSTISSTSSAQRAMICGFFHQ